LLITTANAVNTAMFKLNFDFIRDIVRVTSIVRVPLVMEVHPSVPARTVAEFIAYAEANPGKVNMASAGTGSLTHVAGEMFKTMAGLVRHWRSEAHAGRGHRKTEQARQRQHCRSETPSAACQSGRHGAWRGARRFRQADLRRGQEVEQGDSGSSGNGQQ
jgi:tripartite-type tricarboxylate transporter receptor subunit TctC